MSPALLTFISQRELPLDGVLDMHRTLALLLGVTEQTVTDSQIEGIQPALSSVHRNDRLLIRSRELLCRGSKRLDSGRSRLIEP